MLKISLDCKMFIFRRFVFSKISQNLSSNFHRKTHTHAHSLSLCVYVEKRICDFEHALARSLKHISHFMSILSTLFSRGSFAELFYHLNKPVMMCLRVNVQCANCFDLSRNKSDWHFISIFPGHNRPLPCIGDSCPPCVSLCQHAGGVVFKKRRERVPHTHTFSRARASRIILIYLAFH